MLNARGYSAHIHIVSLLILTILSESLWIPFAHAEHGGAEAMGAEAPAAPAFTTTGAGQNPQEDLSKFNEICGDVLKNADANVKGGGVAGQQVKYCRAADVARKAMKARETTWKLWVGVAGICGTACGLSFAGLYKQWVCIATGLTGTAVDFAITRNFSNVMAGVMGLGGGFMMKGMFNPAAPQVSPADAALGKSAPKPKPKDITACVMAATGAYMAYSSHKTMKTSEQTAKTNLANAKNVKSTATAMGQNPIAPHVPGQVEGATTSGSEGNHASGAAGHENAGMHPACSGEASSIQCAIASGHLPPEMGSPKFAEDFKDATGRELGDLLRSHEGPREALTEALGAHLDGAGLMSMAGGLEKMESAFQQEFNSTYRSGGGGGGGGGGNSDPAAAMMAAVMGKLMNKGQEGTGPTGVHPVVYANQTRLPAEIPQDSSLNIFDRISYRYIVSQRRMEQ